MHSILRRRYAVIVAGLVLVPFSSVQAMHLSARDAVMLRYHYAAGQSYAYRSTVVMHLSMEMPGASAGSTAASATKTMTAVVSGISRYHVLHVDASGGAEAEMSESAMTMRTTIDGQTTTTTLPVMAPSKVYLAADGGERGNVASDYGAYGLQTMSALPAGAVAPGARWDASSAVSLPSTLGLNLAPMHMSAHYVFSKYLHAHGERVAAIDSTGVLQWTSDSSFQGVPVHMHIVESMNGQSLLGLMSGRSVSSQAHVDMRIFMSGQAAGGTSAAIRMHMVMSVSMDPAGW